MSSLVVLALIWVGNFYYFIRQQLSEPIFLTHYYDFYVSQGSQNYFFDLYYLVNKSRDEKIVSVQIPDSNIILNTESSKREDYTHQSLNQLHVELNETQLKALFDSGKTSFNQLYAILDDGSKKLMDIGMVQFIQTESFEFKALGEQSSGSSNANEGFRLMKAQEPIEVTGFSYNFNENLTNSLNVTFDTSQERLKQMNMDSMTTDEPSARNRLFENTGTNLEQLTFPLSLKEGEFLKFNYQFAFNPSAYFSLNGKLTYKTKDGQEHIRPLEMHYTPYFTDKDIKQIIRERRGE